jgi:hypothetical protein
LRFTPGFGLWVRGGFGFLVHGGEGGCAARSRNGGLAPFATPHSFNHPGRYLSRLKGLTATLHHIRASACLQGNLRDGQVHLLPTLSRSTARRYGFAPDP